jgi:hypothetical protein
MEVDTVGERLMDFFRDNNTPISQVATQTGIRYDTLQQMLHGRVKSMGVDNFAIIWKAYPDIDGWYMLTGLHRQQYSHESARALVEELQYFQTFIDSAINKRVQAIQDADAG